MGTGVEPAPLDHHSARGEGSSAREAERGLGYLIRLRKHVFAFCAKRSIACHTRLIWMFTAAPCCTNAVARALLSMEREAGLEGSSH